MLVVLKPCNRSLFHSQSIHYEMCECGFTKVNETPCSLRDAKSMCTVVLHQNYYIMFTGA